MARHTAKSHKIRKVEILVIQILIEQGKSQSERLVLLRNLAIKQMDTLASINLSAVSALPGSDM